MNIAETIIKTYYANIEEMSVEKSLHWATRMWRITGDQKYSDLVLKLFYQASKEVPHQIERSAVSIEKHKKRKEFFTKKPEARNLKNDLTRMFLLSSLGLESSREFKNLNNEISMFDFHSILFDIHFLKVDPPAIANSVYFLKALRIVDYESELVEFFKRNILIKKPKDKVEWANNVYGLTHLILGATYFYQRKISTKLYSKLFEPVLFFFKKNIENILKNTSIDVCIEVALCFKFLGYQNDPVVKFVKEAVMNDFDTSSGFLPYKKGSDLNISEHRNILAVMLFMENLSFTKGPDIGKFAKNNI